jgi:hypothetical protein
MDVFNFAPDRNVPQTLPRDAPTTAVSLGGWQFNARPTTPYQRKFTVTLYGMRWYFRSDGTFDDKMNVNFNARALEMFYEQHETWSPFTFRHQHFGPLVCRFNAPLQVPPGIKNSGGLIDTVEVSLIHHNPGF